MPDDKSHDNPKRSIKDLLANPPRGIVRAREQTELAGTLFRQQRREADAARRETEEVDVLYVDALIAIRDRITTIQKLNTHGDAVVVGQELQRLGANIDGILRSMREV